MEIRGTWARSPLLQGRLVRLEPLDERHLPEMLIAAADPATWTRMPMRLDKEDAIRTGLADTLRARDDATELLRSAVRARLTARLAAHLLPGSSADGPPR
jgi:hypothetical protein